MATVPTPRWFARIVAAKNNAIDGHQVAQRSKASTTSQVFDSKTSKEGWKPQVGEL